MGSLNIIEAFNYYSKHINRTDRFNKLENHNIPIPGSVPPVDWELFGAILTGEKASDGYGADLENYEVKSAGEGGSFEYQYHLNAGLHKLDEDINVDHIFITYTRDYQNVMVRLVKGKYLAETFESWREGLIKNYSGKNRRQRYRKSISLGKVKRLGHVVMEIKEGNLIN